MEVVDIYNRTVRIVYTTVVVDFINQMSNIIFAASFNKLTSTECAKELIYLYANTYQLIDSKIKCSDFTSEFIKNIINRITDLPQERLIRIINIIEINDMAVRYGRRITDKCEMYEIDDSIIEIEDQFELIGLLVELLARTLNIVRRRYVRRYDVRIINDVITVNIGGVYLTNLIPSIRVKYVFRFLLSISAMSSFKIFVNDYSILSKSTKISIFGMLIGRFTMLEDPLLSENSIVITHKDKFRKPEQLYARGKSKSKKTKHMYAYTKSKTCAAREWLNLI